MFQRTSERVTMYVAGASSCSQLEECTCHGNGSPWSSILDIPSSDPPVDRAPNTYGALAAVSLRPGIGKSVELHNERAQVESLRRPFAALTLRPKIGDGALMALSSRSLHALPNFKSQKERRESAV
ncbi:hypothetical protein Bbelb_269000 [Branchiostoma belcheri]|nr:hypothetical protein Bbelb_269000 [Branchiostoma belcheri]